MMLRRFWKDETAATAIEYGLIAGMIAVVIIVSIRGVGTKLSTKMQAISGNLS